MDRFLSLAFVYYFVSVPGFCDFEKGLCSWTNMQQGDDFDWLRSRGRTTSSFTGPSFDHTLSSALGYYMFIESSAPRVPGDKARLYSEVFKPTRDTKCFNFYYNMNGADVGTLNVYLLVNQSRDVFSTEALVWSLQGDNGDQWGMGQFNITSRYTAYPYQVGIYSKLSKIPNTFLYLYLSSPFLQVTSIRNVRIHIVVSLLLILLHNTVHRSKKRKSAIKYHQKSLLAL